MNGEQSRWIVTGNFDRTDPSYDTDLFRFTKQEVTEIKGYCPARNASIPSNSERFRSKDVNSYLLDIQLFDPIRNLSKEK